MLAGMTRSILRWSVRVSLVACLSIGLLSGWQWSTSEAYTLQSRALQESRTYRIFNAHSNGPVIYTLDGNSLKNSLAPAVLFSMAALLRRQDLPKVVATDSHASRDRDFRSLKSAPTYWRPKITGRASDFDQFLLAELVPEIEKRDEGEVRRYRMGHSLAGLYVLDLATREPGRFAGAFAFAPTFSHDTSISERLPKSCHAGTSLYANWGLESARDTEVFDQTVARWKANIDCRQNAPMTPRHYGSLHQTIMLTGQFHVAFWILE